MGVVYRARQRSLNRPVALKLLAPERGHNPTFAARFAREAQALEATNTAHLRVYGTGRSTEGVSDSASCGGLEEFSTLPVQGSVLLSVATRIRAT